MRGVSCPVIYSVPAPSLRKISYKYNSMLTYIPVSFLFSFIFRVPVGVRFGFGFGIVNLIGGAAGTVDPCARKTPVSYSVTGNVPR